MSLLIAIALYALHILRRPLDGRLTRRCFGPIVVTVLAVDLGLIWNEGRPTGVDGIYFLGDLAGLLAVYMMTLSLVLATRIRRLEPWFGGLDRMYLWHKRYSLWAIALITVHIVSTQWDGGRVDPDGRDGTRTRHHLRRRTGSVRTRLTAEGERHHPAAVRAVALHPPVHRSDGGHVSAARLAARSGARLVGTGRVFSSTDGRLTAARVLREVGPVSPDIHIFLCGPDRMLNTLTRDLRRAGISRDHLHTERFAFR
ncbi:ferric reductase-like transmembrane domain-containing protein [Streptomyces sp. NPDC049687]|uniref:ferric reductase-like transmembrane domain-containing protein n=1 Tax=Streptomyces sp. NPDC049687 TaxID=3365596 RepID=UPI0037BACF4A